MHNERPAHSLPSCCERRRPGRHFTRTDLMGIRSTRLLPMGHTHHVTPETLLALAKECFGVSPRAILYTVGVETMELGDKCSPPVQAAMIDLVTQFQGWFLPLQVTEPGLKVYGLKGCSSHELCPFFMDPFLHTLAQVTNLMGDFGVANVTIAQNRLTFASKFVTIYTLPNRNYKIPKRN